MKKARSHKLKKLSKKIGMPPGSLIYIGNTEASHSNKPRISKMVYSADTLEECCAHRRRFSQFYPRP